MEALDARAQEQEAAIVQAAQALAECESTLKARETELAALDYRISAKKGGQRDFLKALKKGDISK